MKLREILNRVEGIVITAKHYIALDSTAELQEQLSKLKAFLNHELNHQPVEQGPEQPAEQPTEQPPQVE